MYVNYKLNGIFPRNIDLAILWCGFHANSTYQLAPVLLALQKYNPSSTNTLTKSKTESANYSSKCTIEVALILYKIKGRKCYLLFKKHFRAASMLYKSKVENDSSNLIDNHMFIWLLRKSLIECKVLKISCQVVKGTPSHQTPTFLTINPGLARSR